MSIFHFLYLAFHGFPQRTTSGYTPGGRYVCEGQRWNLKEDISSELRKGVFEVRQYAVDSILLIRRDGQHHLPQGCAPHFMTDTLDNENFELIGD